MMSESGQSEIAHTSRAPEEGLTEDVLEELSGGTTLAEYLETRGAETFAKLEARGAFELTPDACGLFPATPGAPEVTGMNMYWLRDNASIILALHTTGRTELAVNGAKALLSILNNNRRTLDGVVSGELDPSNPDNRLPVRVKGDNLENDTESRVQNDSVGYALLCISRLIKAGHLEVSEADMTTIAQTVRYLGAIEYWHDEDDGHWEEERRIHASSIGIVIAGLKEAKQLFDQKKYEHDIDFETLIARGSQVLHNMIEQGETERSREAPQEPAQDYMQGANPSKRTREYFQSNQNNRGKRKHDAAMLFLVMLGAVEGEDAARIIEDIESNLVREKGVIRYDGDTYWMPGFPEFMGIEERTTSAEGRLEKRNLRAAGIGYSETEAQWTIFDSALSAYYGRLYLKTGEETYRHKQITYFSRALSQLVKGEDGRLLMPEAYYLDYVADEGRWQWKPNLHTPLNWSHANLLLAAWLLKGVFPPPLQKAS